MAIIPHKHDLLERIFAESITRKMSFTQKKKAETSNKKIVNSSLLS